MFAFLDDPTWPSTSIHGGLIRVDLQTIISLFCDHTRLTYHSAASFHAFATTFLGNIKKAS
jgi:hypothetical protein